MNYASVPRGAAVVAVLTFTLTMAPAGAGAGLQSAKSCAGEKRAGASEHEKETTLRCLVNGVRAGAGLRGLSSNSALERAAGHKAGDLAACGFTHNACGRAADAWAKRYGYTSGSWRWGETIATGRRKMSARAALRAWLNSPPHREAILTGAFEHLGVGLKRSGHHSYWVLQLGCHGC